LEGIYSFLAFYERKTAEVYEKIRPSIKNGTARLLISILAIDSRKHSEVFRHLSGGEVPKTAPEADLGPVAAEAVRILDEAESLIGKKAPLEILEGLVKYEKLMNEEYLVEIYAKALDLKQKNGTIKKVLNSIAEDENRHRDFLEQAISLEKGEAGS
jgi:rubrerythrin